MQDKPNLLVTCQAMVSHSAQVKDEMVTERHRLSDIWYAHRIVSCAYRVRIDVVREDVEADHPNADQDELITLFRNAAFDLGLPRPYRRGTAELTNSAIARQEEELAA